MRGRGAALAVAVTILAGFPTADRSIVDGARRVIREVLADAGRPL